jgi:hypothetical protein
MPAVAEKENTRTVSGKELADILNCTQSTLSTAAHKKYFTRDYPVFEWAEMHPAGNIVRHYHVPVQVLKERLPKEEWSDFAIFADPDEE